MYRPVSQRRHVESFMPRPPGGERRPRFEVSAPVVGREGALRGERGEGRVFVQFLLFPNSPLCRPLVRDIRRVVGVFPDGMVTSKHRDKYVYVII